MSTTHAIAPEHLTHLTRLQHVLEWLHSEQTRLQAEMTHVATQGQRLESDLRSILLHGYGVAPSSPFTLDTDAGTITTPDDPPETVSAPVQESTPAEQPVAASVEISSAASEVVEPAADTEEPEKASA